MAVLIRRTGFPVLFYLRVTCLAAVLGFAGQGFSAVTCNVIKHGPASEADKALLARDWGKAAELYRADLAKHPGDEQLTAGLVHALLGGQKMDDAAEVIKTALAAAPKSAAFVTLRGELELRRGEPWLAEPTVMEAYKLDPCYPRTRLLFSRIAAITSRYATARQQIQIAHQFAPDDPEVRQAWRQTLSLKQRIAELEASLADPSEGDETERRDMQASLDSLKQVSDLPPRSCRLTSPVTSTEIPFVRLMYNPQHMRAFGLEVGLNRDRTARLQIDTGVSGLLLYRPAADRAGIKKGSDAPIAGIGDQGKKRGYTAVVDSLRVGGLEFRDCTVRVIDASSPFDDDDGLIGMDVFAQFLVTLDYPMRKIQLGPLPPRPGETAAPVPGLKTAAGDTEAAAPANESSAPSQPEAKEMKSPSAANPGSNASRINGPYDRYIAPEMKDWVQVYRFGKDLILPASLNGEKVKLFIVDTGSFATSISPQAAREIAKVHGSGMHVTGLNGSVDKVYTVDEITFNFAHLSQKVNNVISFDTSILSRSTGMEISGLLGANTLKLLVMHIDYRDGLVKFDYIPDRGYKFE